MKLISYGTEIVCEIFITLESHYNSFMIKYIQFCKLNLIMLIEMQPGGKKHNIMELKKLLVRIELDIKWSVFSFIQICKPGISYSLKIKYSC
jgi:hypothetical protein